MRTTKIALGVAIMLMTLNGCTMIAFGEDDYYGGDDYYEEGDYYGGDDYYGEDNDIDYEEVYNYMVQDMKYELMEETGIQDIDSIWNSLRYAFYDMDQDGYKELIAEKGTCNADMRCEVYTIVGNEPSFLGEVPGVASSIFAAPEKNGFYEYYGVQMFDTITLVYIEDGKLFTEEVFSGENPNYENSYSELENEIERKSFAEWALESDWETDEWYDTPLEKLRSVAYEENCDNEIIDGMEYYGKNLNHMGDSGNYYDEVMLGSWFNDDGTPKAMFPPQNLSMSMNNSGCLTQLEYFDFINGEDVSIEEVKRRGTDDHWYAIVLLNIQKQQDISGNMNFGGWDPISGEYVFVKGNFDRILNDDSLLVFGTSLGTASDDTLNIRGYYAVIITERIQGLF